MFPNVSKLFSFWAHILSEEVLGIREQTGSHKSCLPYKNGGQIQWRSQNGIIFTHTQDKSWKLCLECLQK